jgi:uncharacterized protein (TIGR03000 family)
MFKRGMWVAILAGSAWVLTPGIDYAKGGGGGGHGGGGHGGGGHGGGGHGGGMHGGGGSWHGGSNWHGGNTWHGNNFNHNHFNNGFIGIGWWGGWGGYWPDYYGWGWGGGGYPYGTGYYDSGYYSTDLAPANLYPGQAQGYRQLPEGAAQTPPGLDPNTAGFLVYVPDPNAEIWFQESPTKQRGNYRAYESGSLSPGQAYSFTVRARWTQDGQVVDRTQNVEARGGQVSRVNFATRERVPAPTPPPPPPGK